MHEMNKLLKAILIFLLIFHSHQDGIFLMYKKKLKIHLAYQLI